MDSLRRTIGKCSMAILVATVSTGTVGLLRGQDKRVPEFHPLNSDPISVRMINQTPGTLYETIAKLAGIIAKLAGINVVWDPKAKQQSETARFNVKLSKATLREALDDVAFLTNTSWTPTSGNTIAVARQQ